MGRSKGKKKTWSRKINGRCTAMMKVNIQASGSAVVKYCKDHYGHEDGQKNLDHITLSDDDRGWLAGQIQEGVPLDTILMKIQEGIDTPNSQRLLMTRKQDLKNLQKRIVQTATNIKSFTCQEPGCSSFTCVDIRRIREKFRHHLEQHHSFSFDVRKRTFSSSDEFDEWTNQLDEEGLACFVVCRIRNLKNGRKQTYYRCSRSTMYKDKDQGHGICTAEMIVLREASGNVTVTYCLDHYGHENW